MNNESAARGCESFFRRKSGDWGKGESGDSPDWNLHCLDRELSLENFTESWSAHYNNTLNWESLPKVERSWVRDYASILVYSSSQSLAPI